MDTPARRLLLAALLLVGAGCPGGAEGPERALDDTQDPATLTDFQRELLQAHNVVRAGATPAPSPPLEPLSWSPHAEAVARQWAEECRFEHNPQRGPLGENLAASTPDMWTPSRVVDSWASEASDYDYAANRCMAGPGESCGHYTQLVWRATSGVGCALKRCTRNSPFGTRFAEWDLWVCNYTPPGNVVGQRPY